MQVSEDRYFFIIKAEQPLSVKLHEKGRGKDEKFTEKLI